MNDTNASASQRDDTNSIVSRWHAVADSLPRCTLGDHVRIVGTGVHGVIVSTHPLVIRDGRGLEYSPSWLLVRLSG